MTEVSVEVHLAPVSIPSKWDIIPIHTSDIANFKRCRRYWDWSSPTRTNLRHKVEIYGINFPMWFGTGIHYALEKYYDPILKRDPLESWNTWFQYQWEGGIVGEEWLELTYDIHPRLLETTGPLPSDLVEPDNTWVIKGLKDILPDPIEEEFMEHKELGIGMLTFYKDYAARKDDFEVVAVESTYSIPLGFEVIDRREESPNYGKKIPVHARGKRDKIAWYPERNKFAVMDHKTAARVDEDYFLKNEKDEQFTNYLWATKYEALHYDLPWYNHQVDRIIVNALRKNYPKEPTILKSGFPSVSRTTEGTTAELFMACVNAEPERVMWFEDDERAQKYYDYLVSQGDDLFIQRDIVFRNDAEIENADKHIKMIAHEMLREDINVYPSPTGAKSCLYCAFRAPCISKDDGSDWQGMLEDGYEYNRDR